MTLGNKWYEFYTETMIFISERWPYSETHIACSWR